MPDRDNIDETMEHEKNEQLRRQQEGNPHWHESLASASESAVRPVLSRIFLSPLFSVTRRGQQDRTLTIPPLSAQQVKADRDETPNSEQTTAMEEEIKKVKSKKVKHEKKF